MKPEMGMVLAENRTLELYVVYGVDELVISKIPTAAVGCGRRGEKHDSERRVKLTPIRKEKKCNDNDNDKIPTIASEPQSTPDRPPIDPQAQTYPQKQTQSILEIPQTEPQRFTKIPDTGPATQNEAQIQTLKTSFQEDVDGIPAGYYDFYDNRPDTPIPLHVLLSDFEDIDNTDPEYEPKVDDSEVEFNPEDFDDDDDDELGDLDGDEFANGYESVYEVGNQYADSSDESDKEIHTPTDSDEEEGSSRVRRRKGPLITADTYWNSFERKVGQRFTTREAFRESVAQYAIAQGRDVRFESSNKKRQKRMEFLEIFKAWPHWPAKEIIETVKRDYKLVIAPRLAYRVKWVAHRMLHGSMKEHYSKHHPHISKPNPTSIAHHEATAQPKRLGRGGRVIRGGLGSRGGRGGRSRGGRGRGRGRGRQGDVPIGVGVFIDLGGTAYTN
ncbi:Antiviral helicase SKI2, partial [Bienertia sinuspersici]